MSNRDGDVLRCSFCGKSQHEVRKLIAGPTVYICNECVEVCLDIIAEDRVHEAKSRQQVLAKPPEIKAYINQLARTGQAVLVDDDAENIEVIQVRPRTSKPGGSEA